MPDGLRVLRGVGDETDRPELHAGVSGCPERALGGSGEVLLRLIHLRPLLRKQGCTSFQRFESVDVGARLRVALLLQFYEGPGLGLS